MMQGVKQDTPNQQISSALMGIQAKRLSTVVMAAAVAGSTALAACSGSGSAKPGTQYGTSSATSAPTPPTVGPHGGVNLDVLVVTDGTPPVQAVEAQLTAEGVPTTIINLHDSSRNTITRAFLARSLPGGGQGGNFEGIVLPSAAPAGLSAAEDDAMAWYERRFEVRQVDAYSAPSPHIGMNLPVYSGPLSGRVTVTSAGAGAGFGYLNASFPFSGGLAGPALFGYLSDPVPGGGATPLLDAAIPGSAGSATLVWQYDSGGRQQLGIAFGYALYQAQFRYLAHGIVTWVTRGVNLGDWRSYLDIAFDDMFLGDSQWSMTGHCTPGDTACPKGTPMTPPIEMTPADIRYAAQWEQQHDFTIEFLYNGGGSVNFEVNGVDPLVQAARPLAKDFYWVNHTYSHAYLGCEQDFRVVPWKCVTSGGKFVWAAGPSLINSQINDNFTWAAKNGIPAEPATVATGEYSGLLLLPQQPIDNPYLDAAMVPDGIEWIAMDASREPNMRNVGAALGVPRHPIDVGYDVDTAAEEVSEFNWYNTSTADGGSGICQGSKTTACIKPLDPATGWTSYIVPGQARIVFNALVANDARPFFMHQSNLAGDRLAYGVMDAILSAYRAVYGPSAPIVNLPMSGDGVVLHDQQLWATALSQHLVTAWVEGRTLTISGAPGTTVPVTVPAGTTAGSGGPTFTSPYAGEVSGYTTLGSGPLTLALGSAPFGG
jgi:hypothetical protein